MEETLGSLPKDREGRGRRSPHSEIDMRRSGKKEGEGSAEGETPLTLRYSKTPSSIFVASSS
jgi:hypothetical protein